MRYRRARVAGGTYFFTVTLADRDRAFLTDYVAVLRDAIRTVKVRHPFEIDAMVILPDHLHAIWKLPAGDANYPTRWALIKATFSRHLPPTEHRNLSRQVKGERGIWQRRYWEHQIRDDDDLNRHVDYIHYNPVKPRLCKECLRLAAFEHSPVYSVGNDDDGLGRGQCRGGEIR